MHIGDHSELKIVDSSALRLKGCDPETHQV